MPRTLPRRRPINRRRFFPKTRRSRKKEPLKLLRPRRPRRRRTELPRMSLRRELPSKRRPKRRWRPRSKPKSRLRRRLR